MSATECRIYVRCLSSYNSGDLRGRWIDATQGVDAIRDEIAEVLADAKAAGFEPAEEWAVHDYDGFGDLSSTLGEYPDLDRVADVAAGIAEHDGPYIAYVGMGRDDGSVDAFRDAYRGEYDSVTAYAEEYVNDSSGDIIKAMGSLAQYFDYESFGHDLELNGDIVSVDAPGGKVWIFDNN